jgi:hypothetical protein
MTPRWEYLLASWQSTTNYYSKASHEAQTWESVYWLTRPDVEPEKLNGEVKWSALLNELGAEGWEMVSESVRRSVVHAHALGWTNAGAPIEIRWTFKRLVE